MFIEGGFGPALPEMGLKHPEKVFDGRFNDCAGAVRDLDQRILPREMEFPSGQVSEGGRTEKSVRKEADLICKQFKKGAQGFGKLTREKGSTFGALAAMVFPENPDLASDLSIEMRFEVGKPPGNDIRVNNQEEELVFQRMPVVSGENCLLGAGLRQMAERRYKNKGSQIVSTVAQLINWDRKENDLEDSLTDNAIAWLKYRSLAQHLRGAGSGIDISLDADKNWHMLAPGIAKQEKQAAGWGWTHNEESGWWLSEYSGYKGKFRFEENQLITEGVSPEDFITIARAVRPTAEEESFHLISEEELRQKGERGEKLQSVSESLPQEPEAEPKESGEIKIAMKTSWASEAVTVAKDANGGVRIDPKNPELPSKWKKDGRQYERRGEVAVIKAGDKEVELSMVDQGTEVTGFPREVENQMSYFFELDFGYQVEAEEVKRWFKDLPVLDYLRGSDPLKWGEAKIERREPGDSLTLTIGQTKYHICVPQHSSNVKVSWFDTRRDDYNENKFPAKELFNDLSAMAEIYTNIWLGKEAGQAVAAEQKPEAPAEAEEKAETSESLQDLARELIDKRERYFEEDDEEKEQKLQERINELENKFEEIFTDGEKGLFRRAFYHSDSVLPDDFISVEKGRDDFISLEYEFAELGVESCAEGRLGDKAIQSLPQLFEKVNGILKRNEKEALMKFDDFLSAFNELVSGAVVPAELEKTEEPEEKPASTEAEKSKKIALTDFRL